MSVRKGKKIDIEVVEPEKKDPGVADNAAPGNTSGNPVESEVVEPEIIEPEILEPEDNGSHDADSAGVAGDGQDEAAEKGSRLEAALQEAATAKDKYVRLQAEWDNYRKRTAAERENDKARAAERLISNLLPVVDDLERALVHAVDAPDLKILTDGVEAVRTKFIAILAKERVEQIDPKDQAFDANRHQAAGSVEDVTVPDETVVQVYQKGYEMAGRVIRPAMVIVSTGGPKREPEESEKSETK